MTVDNLSVENDFDITELNGLRLPAQAKAFAKVSNLSQLAEAVHYADEKNLLLHPIGEGTNTVWGTSLIERMVIKIDIKGREVIEETSTSVTIKFGAGELWDDCVAWTVATEWSGIEALSAIPGTVGAAPIQNIGAYGSEVSQTLESVEVFDIESGKTKTLSTVDCHFGYRDSIFKHEAKNILIVKAITLRLSKDKPTIPHYKDVERYFVDKHITSPTIDEIRQSIQIIRAKKLPDPSVIPNCGSFFKNPIVGLEHAQTLLKQFPSIPHYESENGVKIPAGWLIENAGLKGHSFGHISTYRHNALVLASDGEATIMDVERTVQEITKKISEIYEIQLEVEPEIVRNE